MHRAGDFLAPKFDDAMRRSMLKYGAILVVLSAVERFKQCSPA
jgi:hypothetical protein